MTLHQLNLELAILDSALSELEERRTAIVHRIGSFSSSGNHRSGTLRFPNAITVATYTEAGHIWPAEPNSINLEECPRPKAIDRKPTRAVSKSRRSTKTNQERT
jgi:hypothetical protein